MADWSSRGPPRSINGASSTVTETSGPAASSLPLATPVSAASGSPQQGRGVVNNRVSVGGNTNKGKLQEIGQIDVTASASHPGADVGNNNNEGDVQKVDAIKLKLTGKDEETRDKGGCSIF